MRSVIKQANRVGIAVIVKQQFEIGAHIIATGLVPILEPEVDIHCPQKADLHGGFAFHRNSFVQRRLRRAQYPQVGKFRNVLG